MVPTRRSRDEDRGTTYEMNDEPLPNDQWVVTLRTRPSRGRATTGSRGGHRRRTDRRGGGPRRFLPLNGRFQETVTRWQIRPLPGVPMAANDHTDHSWDDRVLEVLGSLGRRLRPLETETTAVLARFGGYSDRFDLALDQAVRGEARWVDGNNQEIAPWVGDIKATTDWIYWNSYVRQLQSEEPEPGSHPRAGCRHGQHIDGMRQPARTWSWKSKGLVMGDVQSGKTANYCGLISKAADAGYKVMVLLTGVIEDAGTVAGTVGRGFRGS